MQAACDPLGLTPQQRTESNIFAAFRRREIWWPPEVDTRVTAEDGPCLSCDSDQHQPDCISLIARTLHELGLRLDARLVPVDSTP